MFIALSITQSLTIALRPVISRLQKRSPSLTKQLVDAALSARLNLAEGARREGKDQRYLYTVAAGSAAEAREAVEAGAGLGWLDDVELTEVNALFDRQAAILYRLLNPRRR